MALLLERLGITSLTAAGGLDATAVLRNHPGEVSWVLLDLNMPGMSGRATWAALKAADPGLRCCYMTGGGVPRDLRQLLASGAEFVLLKPFTVGALAKLLSRPPAALLLRAGSDRPPSASLTPNARAGQESD